jgi:hypothetical protein
MQILYFLILNNSLNIFKYNVLLLNSDIIIQIIKIFEFNGINTFSQPVTWLK